MHYRLVILPSGILFLPQICRTLWFYDDRCNLSGDHDMQLHGADCVDRAQKKVRLRVLPFCILAIHWFADYDILDACYTSIHMVCALFALTQCLRRLSESGSDNHFFHRRRLKLRDYHLHIDEGLSQVASCK